MSSTQSNDLVVVPLTDFPWNAGELQRTMLDQAYQHAQVVLHELEQLDRPVRFSEYVHKMEGAGFDRSTAVNMFHQLKQSMDQIWVIKFAEKEV